MAGPTFQPLELSVSAQVVEPELLVTVAGELDIATAPALEARLAEKVTPKCRLVIIDASRLTFLDAAGLRALSGASAAWKENVEVLLRAPSRQVRRLLELTDMCGLVDPSVAVPVGEDDRALKTAADVTTSKGG